MPTMNESGGCHNMFADLTNSQKMHISDSMNETLCSESMDETLYYNLPVMAVAPMLSPLLDGDDAIVAATMAALETGTLTPLIKEELKCSILTRRLVEGKDEIVVDFRVPEKKKLTEEEEERVVVRRGQNRVAARKFRQKQKDTESRLLRKTHRLESTNNELRDELNKLRAEKEELQELFKSHLMICPIGLAPTLHVPMP